VTFALVWLCLVGGPASAQELGTQRGTLFVSSEPFAASISLDGSPTGLQTPALLMLAPGAYTLRLERVGHDPVTMEVTLPESGHRVHAFLAARYVTLETPEEASAAGTTLPLGQYRIEREGSLLVVAPEYRLEGFRTTAQILLPFTLTIATGIAAWSYIAPPDDAALALWPAVATQLLSAGIAASALWIELDRTRFLESWRPPADPYRPRAAANLRARAAEALESGDIGQARELYRRMRTEHPDAPGVPEALYTEGRLESIEGNTVEAQALLDELVERYPTIDFYDRALLQLARLAAGMSEPQRAEAYLERITYTDPTVGPEEVNSIRNLLFQ
jgi:hypothetical protein